IKMRGKREQLNEIDIIAKRGKMVMAVECKNYAEPTKVAIKEMRDFISKLDDLGIREGLFVTSTGFSQDAAGWAMKSPQARIRMWDGNDIARELKAVALGRGVNTSLTINNCLKMQSVLENYAEVMLQNKAAVRVAEQTLTFHPYYIIQFSLHERFRSPDSRIHNMNERGTYHMDAITGGITYLRSGTAEVFGEDDNNKQIDIDIENIPPLKSYKMSQTTRFRTDVPEPGKTESEVEFIIRDDVAERNWQKVGYEVRRRRGEMDEFAEFQYVPSPGAIKMNIKMVRVPILEIIFESKNAMYVRKVLPASYTLLVDDIAECRHRSGSKPTFAVCDTCGVAKCRKDIFDGDSGRYFCKEHAPKDVVRRRSITSRIFRR
ncbi:MAG: restriction endonuclease, partial [Alphaproteobacteria bacterium]|nr:restriction endonuclease [Alphaproteobacteria bacterium]